MGDDKSKNDVFTYERLFELLRSEKNSPSLQKLPAQYQEHVKLYLQEKEQDIAKSYSSDNVFSVDDVDNLQTQLRNAKRIVRMIYDLREKKIVQMAMNKSRTSSSVIDTSSLMDFEIDLFKALLNVLDEFRHDKLVPLVEAKRAPHHHHVAESEQEVASPVDAQDGLVLVRVLEDVPEMVGPDMQTYGPYVAEDIASMPQEIADALMQTHKAQRLEPKTP